MFPVFFLPGRKVARLYKVSEAENRLGVEGRQTSHSPYIPCDKHQPHAGIHPWFQDRRAGARSSPGPAPHPVPVAGDGRVGRVPLTWHKMENLRARGCSIHTRVTADAPHQPCLRASAVATVPPPRSLATFQGAAHSLPSPPCPRHYRVLGDRPSS